MDFNQGFNNCNNTFGKNHIKSYKRVRYTCFNLPNSTIRTRETHFSQDLR